MDNVNFSLAQNT